VRPRSQWLCRPQLKAVKKRLRPVSGVNAESGRLTEGGYCLLRSRRSIVVLVRLKRPDIQRDRGFGFRRHGRETIFINLKGRYTTHGRYPSRASPRLIKRRVLAVGASALSCPASQQLTSAIVVPDERKRSTMINLGIAASGG
jgi:hypothetical protein